MPDLSRTFCVQCPPASAGTSGFCNISCGNGQEPRAGRTYCGNCTYDMVSSGVKCEYCEAGFVIDANRSGCLPCSEGHYSGETLRNVSSGSSVTLGYKGVTCKRCLPGSEPTREFNTSARNEIRSTGCLSCTVFGRAFYSADGLTKSNCLEERRVSFPVLHVHTRLAGQQ
jgi:hypothetical protein